MPWKVWAIECEVYKKGEFLGWLGRLFSCLVSYFTKTN